MKPCNKCGQLHPIYEECKPARKPKQASQPVQQSAPKQEEPIKEESVKETAPQKSGETFKERERRHAKQWRDKNRDKYNQYMREYRKQRREHNAN